MPACCARAVWNAPVPMKHRQKTMYRICVFFFIYRLDRVLGTTRSCLILRNVTKGKLPACTAIRYAKRNNRKIVEWNKLIYSMYNHRIRFIGANRFFADSWYEGKMLAVSPIAVQQYAGNSKASVLCPCRIRQKDAPEPFGICSGGGRFSAKMRFDISERIWYGKTVMAWKMAYIIVKNILYGAYRRLFSMIFLVHNADNPYFCIINLE